MLATVFLMVASLIIQRAVVHISSICDRPSLTPCTNDDFECPYWGISRWEVPGSCTEYNFCIEGQHRILRCAPGLVFDPELALCALEDETVCTRELCPLNGGIDNIVTYPSYDENCEEYYMCQGGNLELQRCAPRTHWNQERQRCERPEDAVCEVPPPIVIECPSGSLPVNVPHPTICRNYFLCINEVSHEQECSEGTLFDVITLRCVVANQANCAGGATVRIGTRKIYLVN
ncbi:hypothetical protein HA402_008016 [Bradysia odoriphaga]|nr:hypothetical protein HA402_008016 [Bradysia odoriphaga]